MLLLVRHAAHGHLGNTLSGRTEGIALTREGRAQAEALARKLSSASIDAVEASPVQRAQETASAIAERAGMSVRTARALDEIDFGEWTGRSFAELDNDPRWTEWNERRDVAAAPGGESMVGAQERVMAHLQHVARDHPGQTIVMVTHCDIIRSVVAAVLGLPLQAVHRFDVDPASVTRVIMGEGWSRLKSLNEGYA